MRTGRRPAPLHTLRLRRLQIRSFRLLEPVELALNGGVTIVQGRNAQGKTTLLEAVYYMVTGRSFRTRQDAEVLPWKSEDKEIETAPVALIEGEIARRLGEASLRVVISAEGKRVFCDDKPLDRLGRLWGRFNAVLFTPADLSLVQGGPAVRRRFLDSELSQIDPSYLSALQRYEQALRQRNAILRRYGGDAAASGGPRREEATRLLDAYRDEVIDAGALLIRTRALALEALGRETSRLYGLIANDAEQLHLDYRPSVGAVAPPKNGKPPEDSDDDERVEDADGDDAGVPTSGLTDESSALHELADSDLRSEFARVLESRLGRDLRYRQTTAGPHRDDFAFLLSGRDARDFGSQGQQRSCVLALRLAETAFMREATGETPVLLLDDIVSELDASRRTAFFAALPPDVQVLATATDAETLRPHAPDARIVRVEAGRVLADDGAAPLTEAESEESVEDVNEAAAASDEGSKTS